MKIALSVWKDRISPVFDAARTLLIAEIEAGEIIDRYHASIQFDFPSSRTAMMFNLGVDVLICGAISHLYADMVEAYGICLIPFVAGNAEQVLDAYRRGALPSPEFQMPGCGTKRRRQFRGGRSIQTSREQ